MKFYCMECNKAFNLQDTDGSLACPHCEHATDIQTQDPVRSAANDMITRLAGRIVDSLMSDRQGGLVDRIAVIDADGRDLGGWGYDQAVMHVERVIQDAFWGERT